MKSLARQALHWAGSSVAFLGIGFVAMRLKGYVGSNVISHISTTVWVYCGVLAAFYGMANMLLALAWRHLLLQSNIKVTRRWSVKIYGISQLGKYVPGNIFHIAGRQGMGMAAGIPAGILARTTIWELGMIALSGLLFGWMVLPLIMHGIPILICAILFLLSLYGIVRLLNYLVGHHISISFCQYILFLSISGVIFAILSAMIGNSVGYSPQTWLLIISSYIIAWLAGLITPGAPAGVGVREWILLFLLRSFIAESDLIIAILLGRAVTVVGDLMFFCASFLISLCKVQDGKNYDR